MTNFNFSAVEGHLVKDPELKHTKHGNALCKFTLGSNQTYKDKNGEKVDKANFFDITTWAKVAEACAKYLKKGSRVLVSGNLRKDIWQTDDGSYRSRIYLDGREVNFLSAKA
ncbi:MAG TPA: single-stranded DNA-binding protein [Spirochaetota bacterium]|nr:single-stranded DNA-binding protein [Spirochaetota bacterium]